MRSGVLVPLLFALDSVGKDRRLLLFLSDRKVGVLALTVVLRTACVVSALGGGGSRRVGVLRLSLYGSHAHYSLAHRLRDYHYA